MKENDTISDWEVPLIIPIGDESYLDLSSDYVFDQESLHTYELKIPKTSLEILENDPVTEQYVKGMLIFQGDTISPVGIRYKGSIGGFIGCVSGSDWFNPSGRKICTKLSMKVKINWGEREEKFFDLKKLQFHSQNNDPSQMHERLGYSLFRDMDVPAPRSVHAKLKINGAYVGLFALTEQIDNRFAKYNFEDDEGNIYKEIWPLNMNGIPYSEQQYLSALKTNEDENPSIDLIRNFGQKITDANFSEVPNLILENMDIHEIISLIMIDRTIRHDDGPFHWYCVGGECSNHNYYWYEEPTNKKHHLIPWDLDNTFENIIYQNNPVTTIRDEWGETSNNCQPFSTGFFGPDQWSASCDKLTRGWASFENLYEQKKETFIEGPFSESQINEKLDKWSNQIRKATREASDIHHDAIKEQEWDAALTTLKNQIEYARNH